MAVSVVSHTRVSTAGATSLSLTKPSSGQDGDYALILAVKDDNANGFTTPSGWTLINQKISGLGDDKTIAAFYTKITTWSTWTAPTLEYTESEEAVAQLIIIRGADATTFLSYDANSATYEVETNDVDSTNVWLQAPATASSVAIGDMTVIFGGSRSDAEITGVTQPAGYTGLGGSTITTGWDRAGTGNGDAQYVGSYKIATAAGTETPAQWTGITGFRDWTALTFTIKAGSVTPTYDYQVEAFRVKKDTGGETSTDWLAALNTDPDVDPASDTILRPRWLLYNNDAAIPATADIRLRCQYNGGAAFTVNNTSSYVRSSNSSQISDWQTTTKQLTSETNFTTGYLRANGAAICLIDNKALAAGYWVENGFTIVLRSADLSDGDYVDLFLEYRLTDTDSYQAFDTVDHALRITLTTAANEYDETGRSVSVTGTVTIPTETHLRHYDETDKLVSISATVTEADAFGTNEALQAAITATVSALDQQDMVEATSVSIVATVNATDDVAGSYDESDRPVSVIATVTATDLLAVTEAVSVSATATIEVSDDYATGTGYSLELAGFRVRNDNGTEATATWHSDLNADPDLENADTNIRIRYLIKNNGLALPSTADIRHRASYNGGAAFTINNTSSYLRARDSSYFTDGDPTQQRLGSGTFTTGRMEDGAISAVYNQALPAGNETEHEFSVYLREIDVEVGDYIDTWLEMRPSDSDAYSVFDTLTQACRITVVDTGAEDETGRIVSITATVTIPTESFSGSVTKLPGTDSGGFQLETLISDTSGVWGSQEIMVQCSDIAGVNRSLDGGKSWFTVNRGFYDENHYGAIGFLFSKYTKGTAYYIGVGNTQGGTMYLFKSTNFDATNPDDIVWTLIDWQTGAANKRAGLPYTRTHSRQIVEYDDGSDHYLLLASYSGVWRVKNDGNIGAEDNSNARFLAGYRITSIVVDPNNVDECFLTTDDNTSPGVYRLANAFVGTGTAYRIGYSNQLDNGIELCAVDNNGTTELVVAANPRALDTHGEIYHGTSDPSTATQESDVTWTNKTPTGTAYSWSLWDSVDAKYEGSELHVIIGAAKESGTGQTWYGLLVVTENFENATPTWKLTPDAEAELLDEIYGITPALASWWWDQRGGAWRPNKGVYDAMCVRFNPNDSTRAYAAGDNLSLTEDYTAAAPVWVPAVNGMTCQLARSIHIDPSDDDKMLMGCTDWTQMSTNDGWLRNLSWDDDEVANFYNDTGLSAYYHPDADGKVVTGREEGGVTWYTNIHNGLFETIHWGGEVKVDAGERVEGIVYFDDASGNEITIAYVIGSGNGFMRSVNKGAFTSINSSLTTVSSTNKIAQGVYAGGGVGYFFIPNYGLVRFVNYGASSGDYTRIWASTATGAFTGYLDYDQDGYLWVMANYKLYKVTNPTGTPTVTQINSGTFTRIGAGAAHPTMGGRFGVINDAAAGTDSEFWITKDGGDTWTNEANGEFRRTGNVLTLMADCDSQGKFWFASKGNNVYPLATSLTSDDDDETGRSVSITATVTATDAFGTSEDVTVSATATVTAQDAQGGTEATSVVSGATVTANDVKGMAEACVVSVSATVTATDQRGMTEVGVVSIDGTVTATDQQDMDEAATVSVAVTITIDTETYTPISGFDETNRQVSITATVTATDSLTMSESVTVSSVGTVTATDRQDMTEAVVVSGAATITVATETYTPVSGFDETNLPVSIAATVTATDQQDSSEAATVTATATVTIPTEVYTPGSGPIDYDETGLSVSVTAIVTATDQADMVDASTVSIVATITADDFSWLQMPTVTGLGVTDDGGTLGLTDDGTGLGLTDDGSATGTASGLQSPGRTT